MLLNIITNLQSAVHKLRILINCLNKGGNEIGGVCEYSLARSCCRIQELEDRVLKLIIPSSWVIQTFTTVSKTASSLFLLSSTHSTHVHTLYVSYFHRLMVPSASTLNSLPDSKNQQKFTRIPVSQCPSGLL